MFGQIGAHERGVSLGEATLGGQRDLEHEGIRSQRGAQRGRDRIEIITLGQVDEGVLFALDFIYVGFNASGLCPAWGSAIVSESWRC